MSLRPIDLQVIVPKAQSNPYAREHVVNKEANQLQQTQLLNKQESTKKDNKVNQLDHKSEGRVEERKNASQKDAQTKQSKDKKSDHDDSEDEKKVKKGKPVGIAFHRFDMKV